MKFIKLDAAEWNNVLDFYRALFVALGAPELHGHSIDALLDTMVWSEEINTLKAPYTIVIKNMAKLDSETREEIYLIKNCIVEARGEQKIRWGREVDVSIEIESA